MRTIKVQRLTMEGMENSELGLDEAQRLVKEVLAQGTNVVDRATGNAIDEITPEMEEIIIVEIIGGG